ncbi:hypothetical protein ANN_17017 [Periplaneta americana]|uniref:Thioredoxin domain-containing protein n=1 Tax=Periplaneta americana TaxID=6978 RepID=A0ABQ8SRR0_PERAM|nr:hypothetical protein ANN_17017 [Periplaneta americana]
MELENIDDEADQLGIGFVKIADEQLADEYNLEHLPALVYYRHQIPIIYTNDNDDEDSMQVLGELETIDDDCDKHGIQFVKIDDQAAAKEFGIDDVPALVYFEKGIPNVYDGDLENEDEILEWLVEQLEKDEIEDVTDEMLDRLVKEGKTLAVLFYDNNERKSQHVLNELENIDDECDTLGVVFVKIDNREEAVEYGIEKLPALMYFEKGIPTTYEGNLEDEEKVLQWLDHQVKSDEIEDITDEMLDMLIDKMPNVAVLFCDETWMSHMTPESKQQSMEWRHTALPRKKKFKQIMSTCKIMCTVFWDRKGVLLIEFMPRGETINRETYCQTLKKFRCTIQNKRRGMLTDGVVLLHDNARPHTARDTQNLISKFGWKQIYHPPYSPDLDLSGFHLFLHLKKFLGGDDEVKTAVREWFALQVGEFYNEGIERLVPRLNKCLNNGGDYVEKNLEVHCHSHMSPPSAFILNDKDQKKSQKVLAELENIDDECDHNGIAFVKIDNDEEAKEYGIENLPTLVYFEKKIPHVYEGDLLREEELLGWLVHQKKHSEIPEVTDEMLDRLKDKIEYLVVFFYDKDTKQDMRILNELENIDDELDKEGIVIVRMDNLAEAREYGIDHLPALIYFEEKLPAIYEGDLLNEDEVLQWLIEQKNTATIEEVTDEILQDLIEEHEYVVVYFSGQCEEDEACDDILEELENIDDELDEAGIIFVTTEDLNLAKKHGIRSFPSLVFFRNKDPIIYKGDIEDEDEVLAWLTDEDTLEIPGRIEEVNMRMLDKIFEENAHVVVFFYSEGDKKSQKILSELENIDDECEEKDISFVKTSDEGVDKEYDLPSLPALVFYRSKFRQIYTGDLMHEEAILDWVLDLHESTPDVIESVDRKTLQVLIASVEHLAVFFYDDKCESCPAILEDLETIDDDTDKHGIQFVKSKDSKLASEIGIFSFPALVYYETGVPIMYNGKFITQTNLF